MGFPGGSVVKNPPAKQEMQIQSLDQEDPLEKEMATNSSILALEIPWTEEPGRLQSIGWQRVGHNLPTNTNTFTLRMDFLAPSHLLRNCLTLYCFG